MPSDMRRLDFGSGRYPLAYWLKSVAVLAPGRGRDLTVPLSRLGDWIVAYDGWYKTALGVLQGRRLHCLYHREVAFVGNSLLPAASRLAKFGHVARGLGYGVSLSVGVSEAVESEEAFFSLAALPAFNHVGLIFGEDDCRPENLGLVERLLARTSVKVGIIGPLGGVERMGLLASLALNRADVTIHPTGNLPGGQPPPPSAWVAPCSQSFRLYVDSEGLLFPCLGLLGLPGAALGSVYEPLERTVFGGKPYNLDLGRLALAGPALDPESPAERELALPWTCERHRRAVLAASGQA